jgi:hypothetical protein
LGLAMRHQFGQVCRRILRVRRGRQKHEC